MRADGTLERPDQLAASIETYTGPEERMLRGADLNNLYHFIQEALRYYQAWYVPHPLDPWTGCFPNAWYLSEGAKLKNVENGDTYTIKEVKKDGHTPTGYVTMTGNVEPVSTDRLVFMDESNELQFMHAYPKTYAQTYKFVNGQLPTAETAPWRDTVTFMVTRQTPGSLDGSPFQGTRDRKRKFRKNYDYPGDAKYSARTEGQWFDCLLQLDCWAKTNAVAEDLVDWVQGFMHMYTPVFSANGFPQILFWAREMDGLSTRWRDDIVYRTITYYVRMEDVGYLKQRRIERIFINVGNEPTGEGDLDENRFGTGWDPPATGRDGVLPVEVFETD